MKCMFEEVTNLVSTGEIMDIALKLAKQQNSRAVGYLEGEIKRVKN